MALDEKINRQSPTIGVTGPDKGGEMAWLFTALAVRLAGGRPVRITPARPRTADGLQGLIIGGGADVDPDAYQQAHLIEEYLNNTLKHPRKNLLQRLGSFARKAYYPLLFFMRQLMSRPLKFGLDKARDHLEFQLLDQAARKDLPVLGICRGAQLMNVYYGGNLYQNISNFYTEKPNPASIFPVKEVVVTAGSKLAKVLGVLRLFVNALHKQAVDRAGENIAIVGRETNNVVQAIEHRQATFMLGVQWHPEYLPQRALHRRLFKALVHEASRVQRQIGKADMREVLTRPFPVALESLHQVQ